MLATALLVATASYSVAGQSRRFANLDGELNRRAAAREKQFSSVIVRVKGAELPAQLRKYARPGKLDLVNGYLLDVPDADLPVVASNPAIAFASVNGVVQAFNFRTGVQSGAFFARQMMGLTGAGVSVAVLDSGIAPVDDFNKWQGFGRMPGGNRVTFFKDFLVPNPALTANEPSCTSPCDPNGHGTHVAGTIAGNGFDSFGEKSGIAPEASVIALRVLGRDGSGSLAGVLSALEWVRANAKARNIRVVNLSFGMVPSGSLPADGSVAALLDEDPLAVATKALVDAGIFVVGAGGNFGQIACAGLAGHPTPDPATGKCDVWGGITAPGTYPWVFTAGANSSKGTFGRGDDARAAFSSRGPAFPLQNAKPDLLAGAVGIESAAAPGSTLYRSASRLGFLIPGAFPMATLPYMALSGTSQATAVVSGVAALMLEANPTLTPNLMKAILQYTAEDRVGSNALEDGAGFLNALGAVRLSRFYATARRGQRVPVQPIWSQHFIWGNHEMSGGVMLPGANAWQLGVVWGTPRVNGNTGDNVVWGTSCGLGDCGDNIVWGTSNGDNIVWGTSDGDNVVWGTAGSGDNVVWGTSADGDNVVWGTDCGGQDCGGNVVWGTAASGDNVVWGTARAGDNVVWGTSASGDNVVWGTNSSGDNIVWGTSFGGDNVVWGTAADGDNVVWDTATAEAGGVWDSAADGDNVVWGTDGDNVVWGTNGDNVVWGTGRFLREPLTQTDWYRLFLHRRFSMWWVANEFGDRFVSRNGHVEFRPMKLLKRRLR